MFTNTIFHAPPKIYFTAGKIADFTPSFLPKPLFGCLELLQKDLFLYYF